LHSIDFLVASLVWEDEELLKLWGTPFIKSLGGTLSRHMAHGPFLKSLQNFTNNPVQFSNIIPIY